MPLYEYQCADCGGRDQRVAGLDDHTALCTDCGGIMLRLDEDLFQAYFAGQAEVREALGEFHDRMARARGNLTVVTP